MLHTLFWLNVEYSCLRRIIHANVTYVCNTSRLSKLRNLEAGINTLNMRL